MTDHAGNTEVQNRRRSQNGLIIKLNRAPVMFESKASSIAFATPLIGEARANISSAAAELFSVGNATMTIMGLWYVVDEMRMIFPFPFTLEMDNDAARMFCLGSAHKTKLKHIDCHQEWVRTLRNRDIMTPVQCHVDTDLKDSDINTKILSRGPFEKIRNHITVEHNVHHDE